MSFIGHAFLIAHILKKKSYFRKRLNKSEMDLFYLAGI